MSYETYHDPAKRSGALIIHGCAFESAVADGVLQAIARSYSRLEEVRTFYWFNTKRVSPGSKITMKLSKFYPAWTVCDRQWTEDRADDRYDVSWENGGQVYKAVVYPLPEIAFASWRYQPAVASSHLLLSAEEARFARMVPAADENLSVVLDELKKKKQAGPPDEERKGHRSVILLGAVFDADVRENVRIECPDMYRVTAQVVCRSVQKLITRKNKPAGVSSPAVLFENEEEQLLNSLAITMTRDTSIQFHLC